MTTCYISCACNRVPHSVDWGRNQLICYAACNAVAIYNPGILKIGIILETLCGHKKRINTVRWIKFKNGDPETEILSCSSDGTAIIWSKIDNNSFVSTSILNVGEIVTFSNYLYLDDASNNITYNKLLICTGSSTGELKLWLRDEENNATCFQTLTFGRKLPIESSMSFLPHSNCLLLVVALDDFSIQLLTNNSKTIDLNFEKAQNLLGHVDWIRCIDITNDVDGNLLIATGSQDATIRLWKISIDKEEKLSEDILEQKKQLFNVNEIKYNITLESVLSGHEGWIYGVHWYPVTKDVINSNSVKLLSCSLDKSMIIWESDPATGIWCETVRVGEVGGNSLGFYTCKFSPDGLNILAHSFHGSFHIWRYSESGQKWIPRYAPSGHFGEVVDLCWDPKGRFLISISTDQTTRIHAPYKDGLTELWHEIGRPQVHGYNMACLAILKPYTFASGAEEKVVRIFMAPLNFKKCLGQIADSDDFPNMVVKGANVPALGLTNKAIFDKETEINEDYSKNEDYNPSMEEEINEDYLKNEDYNPSTEEELMEKTLWPELQKLYGHGYEIYSMAAKYDGSLLATACRSTSIEHSSIILWNTEEWSQIQKLSAHQLTVTQLSFSPNGKYLLSVSRDRRWSLFECNDNLYNLVACSLRRDSLHSRIIWCCAWSHDSLYFSTGSRDGNIGIWDESVKEDKPIVPVNSIILGQSVTALSFAPLKIGEHYILAVGYEAGHIDIYKLILHKEHSLYEKYMTYNSMQAHHLTVRRLAFRPQNNEQNNKLQLASCGSDNTIKIYDIVILQNKDLKFY